MILAMQLLSKDFYQITYKMTWILIIKISKDIHTEIVERKEKIKKNNILSLFSNSCKHFVYKFFTLKCNNYYEAEVA